MENKFIFIGALGAFFLATAATMVSDMHGVGDWFISSFQMEKKIGRASCRERV